MTIKAVLFDLDGTLLPMDQDIFVKEYFTLLAGKLAPYGYDAGELVDAVWAGTAAMIKNDGSCCNEEAFWKRFSAILGEKIWADKPIFEEYYGREFQNAARVCGYNPKAKETVAFLKEKGYFVGLATNPIFPAIATESRIRWAGLSPTDFAFYTTYENSSTCKPNPEYYRSLLNRVDCRPEECLMVGNDVEEDLVAQTVGMQVFLLTDCMINKKGKDVSAVAQGGFDELMEYIQRETKQENNNA